MSRYDSTRSKRYNPKIRYTSEQFAEIIEIECKDSGIEFLGFASEWKGTNRTKVSIKCPKHGIVSSTNVNRFLNQGVRCKHCSISEIGQARKKDADHWKGLLIEKCGYPDSIDVAIKNNEPHLWCPACADDKISKAGISDGWFRASTGTIHYGGKPCRCSPKYRMTAHERRFLVESRCSELGYFLVRPKTNGVKAKQNITMECPDHGEFSSAVGNFLWLETVCPSCAVYGYQRKQAGFVYLLYSDCGQYMKIGLTNKMKSRLKGLRTTTPFGFSIAAIKEFDSGAEALGFEKEMHARFSHSGLRGFKGSTEWFNLDGMALNYF